jgi:hypothetical protein
MEVEVASQISPPFIGHFVRNLDGENALTVDAVVNESIISVDSVVGAVVGQGIILTDDANVRFYIGHILAIDTLDLTLDSPLNFDYPIASTAVGYLSHDMDVDGSVTPVVFGVRAGEPFTSPLDSVEVDLTRTLMSMITVTAPDLTKFGDLPKLTNGCVLRVNNGDGTYNNLLNIKDNYDLAAAAYDLSILLKTNPVQGVDGLVWRMTFGGESKMGTVVRLDHTRDLEWVIQDNLTGITRFECIAEGALVAD